MRSRPFLPSANLSALLAFTFTTVPLQAQEPGTPDTLNAPAGGTGDVLATAVQPDRKIIIAGAFTSITGVARRNIARLNADGTLDTGFAPSPDGTVECITIQADGKVLIGGNFTAIQPDGSTPPVARRHIARLNANGTVDPLFDPRADGIVHTIVPQANGDLLLGGAFTTLQPNGAPVPAMRNHAARIHADGTLDQTFNPNADSDVTCLVQQADGRILLGGQFVSLQPNGAALPVPRRRLARLNADGTLDLLFDPSCSGTVNCLAAQPDGKIVIAGAFTTLQPNGNPVAVTRNRIARLNAEGTLDTAFDPNANNVVASLALQSDGRIVVGGNFTSFRPNGAPVSTVRNYVARLNREGSLDAIFNPGADAIVFSVALQPDGRVLLGGGFTALGPPGSPLVLRSYFARLHNDPVTETLSAPGAGDILWQRGGASPEVSSVTFDYSANGGLNWTPLGQAARAGSSADWKLTGLSLPAGTLQLRARGRVSNGWWAGGSGILETVFQVTPGQPRDAWRRSYFGENATNSGAAADGADPEGDGTANIVEYALRSHPLQSAAPSGPVIALGPSNLTFTFYRNPAATDVNLRVEAATTPAPGGWTVLATRAAGAAGWTSAVGVTTAETDTGLVTVTKSSIPAPPNRLLLRLTVATP